MTEKRFNDEEVSLILRRAMETDRDRAEGGLTLTQLKEIAVEVGVDPAQIESAALAVQSQSAGTHGSVGGTPVSTRYEVDVPGEVDEAGYADVLRVIRRAMGRQGVVTEEFGGLSWRARDAFGGRYLTVRSENGRTHVEAMGNFRDGAMISGAGGGTMGLAVSAVVLKALGGIGVMGLIGPPVLIAGAVIPALAFFRRGFKKEDAQLRQAVAEITAEVGAAVLPEGTTQD
jgi:hypothetical protein